MIHSGYVLLADDNATDAELTTHALQVGGVSRNIVWVQDGEAALNFLMRKGEYAQRSAELPRLMLLDLHMPRIDGLDVLARIKSDPQLRGIPVVIMSSSDQDSDMLSSYERHANSYFVKPVDFKQFTEQVAILGRYWMTVNKAMG
jgi:two-component system, response regulator